MKINILYDDFGSVKFDTIEVEEKPKTYKTVGNHIPRIYLNTINKKILNKVYEDRVLIYDCSKEEAIKIWNEHFTNKINVTKEKFCTTIKNLENLLIE